ncbi:hypothetical protein DFS34DRAFT_162199 [Phlyctochytrium arcticum]|nr:hypothetical protein DFS34DRAFT_162199 [Phlyctochytrium arcticum]
MLASPLDSSSSCSDSEPRTFKGAALLVMGTCALLERKNEIRALWLFQKAEKENSVLAMSLIAFFTEFQMGHGKAPGGLIPKESYILAERLYLSAAKRGCALAQARLAFLKTHGRPGIKINHAQAERWRKQCADQGQSALNWMVQAADAGIAAAQFSLALCYYNGIAVAEDDEQAFFWCDRAAHQGHAGAQNVLGNLYVEGSGCAKDPQSGLRWYIRAAEQREAAAIYNIGTLFERGIAVNEQPTQALDWYRRAAEFGSVNAHNVLGIFYEQGTGLHQPSPSDAVAHYLLAAKEGHPHAQYNLARCYHDAIGVRSDNTRATIWFQNAAAQNHAVSQLSLGICYEHGIGVPCSDSLARLNYRAAASTGCTEARKRMRPSAALEMLPPCRIILNIPTTIPAPSSTSSTPSLHQLPYEILEHILSFVDTSRLLSSKDIRAIRNIASDRRTLSGKMGRMDFLDILGLKELDMGQLPLSKCSCVGPSCQSIRHIVDTIEMFEPVHKPWINLSQRRDSTDSSSLPSISPISPAAEPSSFDDFPLSEVAPAAEGSSYLFLSDAVDPLRAARRGSTKWPILSSNSEQLT